MLKSCFLLFFIFLLLSCSNNNKKTLSENLVRKEAVSLAIDYARGKFKEAKETIEKNGIITVTDNQLNFITIGENQIKYVIDPVMVTVGLIDDDATKDAIVTIFPSRGQYLETPENLILINTEGKLMLNRVIESDMKILGIKNRLITAEIHKLPSDSPNYNCSICREVVNYKFENGSLIKTK